MAYSDSPPQRAVKVGIGGRNLESRTTAETGGMTLTGLLLGSWFSDFSFVIYIYIQ